MSAMRMITMDELHKSLQKNGFERTNHTTDTHTLWLYVETGKHYTVPHHPDRVPDSFLDFYLNAVDKLYQHPTVDGDIKHYNVSEKRPRLSAVE